MEKLDLKSTKTKLAIVFTIIVFVIASFLEIIYFSLRYYNIAYNEQKEFRDISQKINSDFSLSPLFLKLFLTQWINFKPPLEERINWEKRKNWFDKWFRFMNFLVLDNSWKIVAQNLNQDFNMDLDLQWLNYDEIKKDDWIFMVKIDVSFVWNEYKDLILFKKQMYSVDDYFKDLIFFFLVNLIFSIFFYYIWLFFVSKNLKPVQNTLNDMNDFIHNANHELKTPISVINSNLWLLRETKTFEQDLIDDSINEIKRLDNLIKWLSNLSNITITSKTQTLNLQNEIQEIIQELSQNIQQKNINLQFDIIKNTKITANKEYFYIMFSNLLRNAIKYNFENWKIKILLDKNKLTISNTWEWISKQDLPNIFQRFFKWEKSRNSQWFWIWLSLVKKICDIYSWNIWVFSDEKETIFDIKF